MSAMVCNRVARTGSTSLIQDRVWSRFFYDCTRILFDERSRGQKQNDFPTKQAVLNNLWTNSTGFCWLQGGAINCSLNRELGSETWSNVWVTKFRSGWLVRMVLRSRRCSLCDIDHASFTNMGAQTQGFTISAACRFCSGSSSKKVRRRGRRKSILVVPT
jgi:hypothetical protein